MRILLSKHATDPTYPMVDLTRNSSHTSAMPDAVVAVADPEYEVLLKIHDKVTLRKDISVFSIRGDAEYNYSKYKSNQSPVNLVKLVPSMEEQRFWETHQKRKDAYISFITDKIKMASLGKDINHHSSPLNQLKQKSLQRTARKLSQLQSESPRAPSLMTSPRLSPSWQQIEQNFGFTFLRDLPLNENEGRPALDSNSDAQPNSGYSSMLQPMPLTD